MDPLEGRFVLHGHISEGGPVAEGGLAAEAVAEALEKSLSETLVALAAGDSPCHGPLVLRLSIAPSGEVRTVRPLLDRLARADGGPTADAVERVLSLVASMRFPAAPAETWVNAPLLIGGALPRPD
jgi:hypothetical protein